MKRLTTLQEAPVLAVSPSENDKKDRTSFVKILRIIQENGVQHGTLFVLIVEGRATFRRFVVVKRKQINGCGTRSIDIYDSIGTALSGTRCHDCHN